MATYIRKDKEEILRQALRTLELKTDIRATSPGSIARAFTEAISSEVAGLYDALDYNLSQNLVSTASGSGLDLLGKLHGIQRKTVDDIIIANREVASFYFYIDSTHGSNITIPEGTKVYTSIETYVGQQTAFETLSDTTISAGQNRAYVALKALNPDKAHTAGKNTLVIHNFPSPSGVTVKCTNPKSITALRGLESDNNLRARIIKSIRTNTGGTMEAVRFSILAVPGVRDSRIISSPYGMGSFEVVVTPERYSSNRDVLRDVRTEIDKSRPIGVQVYIRTPVIVPVDISVNIVMDLKSTLTRSAAEERVSTAITRYLNNLLAGEKLVYNKMVQFIMDVSPYVLDLQFTRLAPNGVEVLRQNYSPEPREQLVAGTISSNVIEV